MLRPLSLGIGLRYLRAKRRNQFISFISLVSMLGIALGVMVLVMVLSVMNGFDEELRTRILSMVPHVTVSTWNNQVTDWPSLASQIKQEPEVKAVAPFVSLEVMLSAQGNLAFVVLKGIDPLLEPTVSPMANSVVAGRLDALQPHQFGIILGQALAEQLGLSVGDKLTAYVPKADFSPVGVLPRVRQFRVVGIFKVGYEYDYNSALINIQDAAALLKLKPGVVGGLQVSVSDLFKAPQVTQQLAQVLAPNYRVWDWTSQNANFFKALQMEKLMMSLILTLIVAVAAFNMLSSLVMLVMDKASDIAVLRTLGMTTAQIMGIFMVQGLAVGLLGIFLGLSLGIIGALNITAWTDWLQRVFGIQFLNAKVYYISFLPSHLVWSDVFHIGLIALMLSFLATLYPAWRAASIRPAEALRHE